MQRVAHSMIGILVMSKIITGSWVWVTKGLYDGQYAQVLSFAGVFAECRFPNNDMAIIPIAYLVLAAQ